MAEEMPKAIKNKAKIEYIKGTKQKDICEMLGISLNTLKSWVRRYNWKDEKALKKNAPKNKRGAPFGSMNAKGNKGGCPPKGNKNSEKHGFFSKYLPEDTLELVGEIGRMNPVDILWNNIQIQYAAIVRAQKIMHVKSQEDMTKVLKRQKEATGAHSNSWEKEYELQHAWDKQDTFLTAQSRAMKELTNMIVKYEDLCKSELATEEQKARIQVLKSKVNTAENETIEDDGFIEALKAGVEGTWED